MFVAVGRPAIAVTSCNLELRCRETVHTRADRIELVDCERLAAAAITLNEMPSDLTGSPGL